MIYDPNACPGNTGSANHQAVGKSEEGPLGNTHARWEVKNKGRASDVCRIALVLEESETLLAIWKNRRTVRIFRL